MAKKQPQDEPKKTMTQEEKGFWATYWKVILIVLVLAVLVGLILAIG